MNYPCKVKVATADIMLCFFTDLKLTQTSDRVVMYASHSDKLAKRRSWCVQLWSAFIHHVNSFIPETGRWSLTQHSRQTETAEVHRETVSFTTRKPSAFRCGYRKRWFEKINPRGSLPPSWPLQWDVHFFQAEASSSRVKYELFLPRFGSQCKSRLAVRVTSFLN